MRKKDMIFDVLSRFGICVSRTSHQKKVINLMKSLEVGRKINLVRMGGFGDGGYWIPENLSGIKYCFSPGVANSSSFETDLAARGIFVFLADKTVDGPPQKNSHFKFIKKHLASFSDSKNALISFEDWYNESIPEQERSHDLLLQMDIEGSEYEVIHSIPQSLLKKIKVLVIEFHNLHQILNCNQIDAIERVFQKILIDFDVAHVEENGVAGKFRFANQSFSRLLEITFIRKY